MSLSETHHEARALTDDVHAISPKFFRKITYVNTLSDLALQVPITQIDIPPAVYQCVSIRISVVVHF